MNVMTEMLIISSIHIQWRQDNNGTLRDETVDNDVTSEKAPIYRQRQMDCAF
jgi:hypothetical protein